MSSLPEKRFLAIGSGKFAIDCIKVLEKTPGAELVLVIAPPDKQKLGVSVARFCARREIPYLETDVINSDIVLRAASEAKADLGFSLNNFSIVKQPLLLLPKDGFVNFHNGPLPKYAGVNVCSWAIINGESKYGVTWHYLDETIDTGDVISQSLFSVAPDETARSLTMKCINQGVFLFQQMLPKLVSGQAMRHAQQDKEFSYFGLGKTPNGGRIDFSWSYERIDRLVRGLNFHPFPNDFVYPFTSYSGRQCFVQSVEKIKDYPLAGIAGEIVSLGRDHLHVVAGDAIIELVSILSDSYQLLGPAEFSDQYRLVVGGRFE